MEKLYIANLFMTMMDRQSCDVYLLRSTQQSIYRITEIIHAIK